MQAYIGEIRLFAGNYAPANWAMCDGAQLPISGNETLFSLIGSTYGGDDRTVFNLPNLTGRLPIGEGQGPGLNNHALGSSGGAEALYLTAPQLPAHTHPIYASSAPATQASPDSTVTLATTASNLRFYVDTGQGSVTSVQTLNAADVSATGGGDPHENIMPCMVVNYIICVNGLFPH